MPSLLVVVGAILILCVLFVVWLITRSPEGREGPRGFEAGPPGASGNSAGAPADRAPSAEGQTRDRAPVPAKK
jgi:hypothetical protein